MHSQDCTNKGGGDAPFDRLTDVSPEGHTVNNVTKENRNHVHAKNPWLLITLMDEDLRKTLHMVYIPNTREMPDIVLYEGKPYTVVDTTKGVPVYSECMVATATANPNEGK